jgi:hypothetical protein
MALQKFIDADPQRKATYGTVLEQTGRIYAEMSARARYELVLDNLASMSLPLRAALSVVEASRETAKPGERGGAARNQAANFANYHEGAEKLFLKKVLTMAAQLRWRVAPVDQRRRATIPATSRAWWTGVCHHYPQHPEASPYGKSAEELRRADFHAAASRPPKRVRDVRQRRNAEL